MTIVGRTQPLRERTSRHFRPRWGLTIEGPWWGDGREFGAPNRINLTTPWGWLGIAYTPGSRFVSSWNPETRHYDDVTHWIHWAPR
jgi:hypothetical protein